MFYLIGLGHRSLNCVVFRLSDLVPRLETGLGNDLSILKALGWLISYTSIQITYTNVVAEKFGGSEMLLHLGLGWSNFFYDNPQFGETWFRDYLHLKKQISPMHECFFLWITLSCQFSTINYLLYSRGPMCLLILLNLISVH